MAIFNYLSLISEYTLQYMFYDKIFKYFSFKESTMLRFLGRVCWRDIAEGRGEKVLAVSIKVHAVEPATAVGQNMISL